MAKNTGLSVTFYRHGLASELLQQVFALVEGKQANGDMPSFPHLAFAFLMAFKVDYSVKYFTKLLRKNKLLEEDFWYIYGRVDHGNEPGRIREV